MPIFEVNTTATPDPTGRIITFEDVSNYGVGNNDENYVKAGFSENTISIEDADGEVLQTSNFLATTTVTFNQTKDNWFTVVRTLNGVTSKIRVQKFAIKRMVMNKLTQALEDGGCECDNSEHMCKVSAFLQAADYAEPLGKSVRWQKFVDAASVYLDLMTK